MPDSQIAKDQSSIRGHPSASVGVVVIGRNEGDRLRCCLESVRQRARTVVYVDSGSSDGSVDMARGMGAEVVELDISIPFTAARARNAGLEQLLALDPQCDYVQFVDGDCEITDGWLFAAIYELDREPDLAVVCGRRRERFPEASVYNAMCDIEWNTPIGEAVACGGDAMMRVCAFRKVGGFRSSLIAGEEPELCCRLRRKGWRIKRIDREMTLHDAAITTFKQWWRRAMRAGHAYAEVSFLHRASESRIWRRETRSAWGWAVVAPMMAVAPAAFGFPSSLVLLGLYPAWLIKITISCRRRDVPWKTSLEYGLACLIGKFAELWGQLRFITSLVKGQHTKLIEYK